MTILFVIIFTTFLHRGCNFTLLGIYSNLFLLAQGHFHNDICLWIHIGQSEVIFVFHCSLVREAEYAGAASYFTFSGLESVFLTGLLPLTAAKDPRSKRLGLGTSRVLVQEKNKCPHCRLETAVPNGETVEQTCSFYGDESFVVVMRQQQ